jgi:two-component system, sporulation sensor kinase E
MNRRHNKFFDKFIDNLSRLDEFNVKRYIEDTENERRTLSDTLNLLDEGILVLKDARIIFINNAARKILLTTGLPVPISIEEAKKQVVNRQLLDFIMVTLYDDDYSTEIIEKNRDTRYYSIQKLSTENHFHIIKLRDITNDKTLEFQLKNLGSISALNTLAAGIAHEIKNPLTAIDLHTQIIKKGIEKKMIEVPEQVEKYIQIIDEEQKRLAKIVNDFLLAARKRELKPTYEDVNEFLKDIVKLIGPEIKENRVELTEDYQDVPKIFIDRDYLKQAVINVLKNALEAMQSQPLKVLKISTYYDHVSDSVCISVADTGPGIETEKMQKIFEPYYTTKDNGTGLGLTIVYKIVEEHGGEIKVDGKPGEGAKFTVCIPLNKGPRLIKRD